MEDVVIVGAGPAGLAAAAMLLHIRSMQRCWSVGIASASRGGHAMTRLHLHTVRWLSGLPGYRIPADFGRWAARDNFVEYLEQYAAHHHLEPRLGIETRRIDRDNGRWLVRTSNGTIPARVVVVASGYTPPNLPQWPGSFDGPIVHSVDSLVFCTKSARTLGG